MRRIAGEEGGIALIEVLVSAIVLVIVAAGAFTAFSAGTRATALERNRARANALAEQELERVRALRIGDLSSLNLTRTLSADGTTYTINSLSQFLTEIATTSTCASGAGSRDYLRLTASVTWPNMGPHPAVTASTIVSPPSGSLVPNSGSLLINLTTRPAPGSPARL
jgi:Tfp pilus assembly protein PilV